ncbi:MAG: hypothetical protein Q8R60_14990 [Mycobacteriales bacterium]|nr:hypothetical protein [Mycobacteriales bacterium]
MPKTPPSRADLELIAKLAEDDIRVSRGQLDRWRQRGLLPRSEVKRLGAFGSRAQHDERTVTIAGVLGSCARRGVPWKELGLVLLLIGEPPAPAVLRECLAWALDSLELPEQDPILSLEERVEAEWRSQGPLFENFQALANQAEIKDENHRNEFAYALIQARLGEDFGPEQDIDIEKGVAQWKAARVGADSAHLVASMRLTPQLLRESRGILAEASDDDLEVISYITHISQSLGLADLDDDSYMRVLRAQSPTALGLKLLHNIKAVRETGKRPLDVFVELLGYCSDRQREWGFSKVSSVIERLHQDQAGRLRASSQEPIEASKP